MYWVTLCDRHHAKHWIYKECSKLPWGTYSLVGKHAHTTVTVGYVGNYDRNNAECVTETQRK